MDCGKNIVYQGEEYPTVKIGEQCWLAKNLNVGTMITASATPTNNASIEKWCNGADGNKHTTSGDCATYGGLYSWDEMMGYTTKAGAQGICPSGWHIPTDAEYKTLVESQSTPGCESTGGGGSSCYPSGANLSTATLNGTNSSGFTVLFAGSHSTGLFYNRGICTNLWTSSESGATVWTRYLSSASSLVGHHSMGKTIGFSVRCVQDIKAKKETTTTTKTIPIKKIEKETSTNKDKTDVDCGKNIVYQGEEYPTVKIGKQCWLAKNLNVGTMLASPATMPTNNTSIEKWCNGADGDKHTTSGDCATYGGLYSWDEMMKYTTKEGTQGICPSGWHIPTDAEWYILESGLATGTCTSTRSNLECNPAGTKLKTGKSSGFNGISAGFRDTNRLFYDRGTYAGLWSSSESGTTAWSRTLYSASSKVSRYTFDKSLGLSVRCVQDIKTKKETTTKTIPIKKIEVDCGQNIVYQGEEYPTVKIGEQCWLAKNLNVGTMITVSAKPTNNASIEKWCNGADGNKHTTSGDCATYGGLYSWDEMMGYTTKEGAQGICPSGWHIPTDAEWDTLYKGLEPNVGTKLETGGSSGFNGIFPGFRFTKAKGMFLNQDIGAYLWSSSESGTDAWELSLSANSSVRRNTFSKSYGCSVRCVQD